MAIRELTPEEACTLVDPTSLKFTTTEEVGPLSGIASQTRAIAALSFGLDMRQARFHVVVVGLPGTGRTFCARAVAKRIARSRPTPDDVLLFSNPRRPAEPAALSMPAGEGRPFVEAMEDLHAKLSDALRGAGEGERFKQARSKIRRRVTAEEAKLEEWLRQIAREAGCDVVRREGEIEIVTPEDGGNASVEAMQAVAAAVAELESKLAGVQEEADTELRSVMKQLLADGAKSCFAPVLQRYESRTDIGRFLSELETAVVKELRRLVDETREEPPSLPRGLVIPTLLTEHIPSDGAPVIEALYPTQTALFGRMHVSPESGAAPEPGFAVAGALHQANGGFLILPATSLLKNEGLYEQLKACLLAGRFIVPEHNPSYFRGSADELSFPPIPIDVKVILVASPNTYQDLHESDPEFSQLFKVQARFESELSLNEAMLTYPSFLASISRDRKHLPLGADAVSELLYYGGRVAESQTKVTAQLGVIAEVAAEANYIAERAGKTVVDRKSVSDALEAAQRRGSHSRDIVYELLSRGTIRVDTSGERIGQVNAISVIFDGPLMFGRPCRVTSVVYPGVEGPVNIAREVEMSGPIHSKGVLILSGFLASRFAQKRPLSFSASLVFEQTYEAIDGDSASSSELYAMLSALSGYPLTQGLAVTGSVDQQGGIQPVGGLNEKIEAFYDLCCAKGLTGRQGVIIPVGNRDALMLRRDVVAAIQDRQFHIYAVTTVEEGIELLTGHSAGTPDENGAYAEGTVFHAAAKRLELFHSAMGEFLRGVR
ncbi:MAG: AAA family ATPase [Polyangiaceae bacterium]|nr:AAA family ATPase [Polyangiaceae bacterium]